MLKKDAAGAVGLKHAKSNNKPLHSLYFTKVSSQCFTHLCLKYKTQGQERWLSSQESTLLLQRTQGPKFGSQDLDQVAYNYL